MIVRALAIDVQGGFLPLICIIDLSSSLVAITEDGFCVVAGVLEFIAWLRGSPTVINWLHAALGAHAHGNVANHEDKGDGKNGEEDDQVLDCVSHGRRLLCNDLSLGYLRDQLLLLYLRLLVLAIRATA